MFCTIFRFNFTSELNGCFVFSESIVMHRYKIAKCITSGMRGSVDTDSSILWLRCVNACVAVSWGYILRQCMILRYGNRQTMRIMTHCQCRYVQSFALCIVHLATWGFLDKITHYVQAGINSGENLLFQVAESNIHRLKGIFAFDSKMATLVNGLQHYLKFVEFSALI